MPVEPSYLTSEERSDLQDIHGLCWNTADVFDDDEPTYFEIQQYHRDIADGGHSVSYTHLTLPTTPYV